MKKIYIVVLLVGILIAGVLVLTGCGNNSIEETEKENISETTTINGVKYSLTDSESFHGMKFKYEKDAKNFKIKDSTQDNNMALIYLQDGTEDDLLRITLSYCKDTDVKNELANFDLDADTVKTSFSTPKSLNFDLDDYVKLFMTNVSF